MKKIKIGELELRQVDLLGGMSYQQQLNLLFPEGNYVSLVRWINSPAGKSAIVYYHKMSWAERIANLNEIVPWQVERHQLMTATTRLKYPKSKKESNDTAKV